VASAGRRARPEWEMPARAQSDVLQPTCDSRADPRQPADSLGEDRIALVRHADSLLSGTETLLDSRTRCAAGPISWPNRSRPPPAIAIDETTAWRITGDDLGGESSRASQPSITRCSARADRCVGATARRASDRHCSKAFVNVEVAVRLNRPASAGRSGSRTPWCPATQEFHRTPWLDDQPSR